MINSSCHPDFPVRGLLCTLIISPEGGGISTAGKCIRDIPTTHGRSMIIHVMMVVFFACISVYARNIELLNPDEQQILDTLEGMQWSDDLSEDQEVYINNALCSTKDAIAEVALSVAILHDMPGLREMLQREVGPSDGYSRILANTVICGLKEGQSAIESLLSNNLLKQVPIDAQAEVRENANHIIAYFVARVLRRGEVPKFEWDDLEYSSYERRLLQYSKRPSAEVTREIIRELGQASVAGAVEYDLVRVLNSYEEIDVGAVLEVLKDKDTGVYGKVLLLTCIEYQVSKMTEEDRQKVKTSLGKYEAKNKIVERALKRVKNQLGDGCISTPVQR